MMNTRHDQTRFTARRVFYRLRRKNDTIFSPALIYCSAVPVVVMSHMDAGTG